MEAEMERGRCVPRDEREESEGAEGPIDEEDSGRRHGERFAARDSASTVESESDGANVGRAAQPTA